MSAGDGTFARGTAGAPVRPRFGYGTNGLTDLRLDDALGRALWAQVAGHRWLAVLALAEATAFRQTSLIWGALFVAWEYLRADEPRRTFLRRIGRLAALGAAAAASLAGKFAPKATIPFGSMLAAVVGGQAARGGDAHGFRPRSPSPAAPCAPLPRSCRSTTAA